MVQVNGTLDVASLTVGQGGVLVSKTGLEVWSEDGIVVFGSVLGAPGAPIALHSRKGNILVLGQVAAARGLDGDAPGKPGQAGGNVHLSAPQGEVVAAGTVRAGAGGDGAAALDLPSPADTRGGNGGAGGGVFLEGLRISVRSGRVAAGNGGNGGDAQAEGGSPEAILEWIVEHTRSGGPMDPPPDGAPLPELFPAHQIQNKKIAALSGHGGAGGSLRLAAATQGQGLIRAALEAGKGGNSGNAEALRGENAKAYAGLPGPGGNLLYEISGPAGGGWQRNAAEKPGQGGNAGSARAGGTEFAEAHIDGGGTGGETRMQGAATTPREKGGDAGAGSVRTSQCHRTSPSAVGAISLPAAPVELKCP
jgi:hypothetical protein